MIRQTRRIPSRKASRNASLLAVVVLLAGCATAQPVLYPNAASQLGGKAGSEAAVKACTDQADAADLSKGSNEVARSTGTGAVIGGVTGAAVGAVFGNAGRGAAAGAAGGGAHGLVGGLFRAKQPSPVYQAYVNRCLRDKGYDVIGWQ